MRINRKYVKEIRKQLGYHATWLPGTPLELGDVGIMKKGVFIKMANLKDFDIEFEKEYDRTTSDINYTSKGSVSVSVKASGTVSPTGSSLTNADVGISVEFSKENSILLKTKDTTSPVIENQIELGETILAKFREGEWNKDWVIITELVKAKSATVLVSSSSSSKIELRAKSDIDASKIDIADANAELTVASNKHVATEVIAQESLTPLFRASKVKSTIFAPPQFKTHGIKSIDLITSLQAKENPGIISFEEVEYDEDIDDEN